MKAKVNFSKVQGRKDDAKFHSVSEFCRIVANDVNTDIYGYFMNFYAAFLADTNSEKRNENEPLADFQKRIMLRATLKAKSTPTKELKETELYKTFSSKNQLFKLIRSISPAYYDNENKHQFATLRKVAHNAGKFSSEKVAELVADGFKQITVKHNGKDINVLTKQYKTENGTFSKAETESFFASQLQAQRKQRKERFADMKESTVFFFDANENVCTLVSSDKMNFSMMYAYVSEYAQRENFAKVSTAREKERNIKLQKDQMKRQQKADAVLSKAFNSLLEYRNNVASEYNNEFIADENARNLVVAEFIKRTTEYKAACQKRFENWKENENPFLQDTVKVVRALTIQPVQPKAAAKKGKKNATAKVAA